jgi:hypothetical protein
MNALELQLLTVVARPSETFDIPSFIQIFGPRAPLAPVDTRTSQDARSEARVPRPVSSASSR